MKSVLKYFCIIFATLIFSCDDKDAALEDLNVAPQMQYFSTELGEWQPAIGFIAGYAKVWTPDNNLNYSVALRAQDFNNNYGEMQVTSDANDLYFFINETPYVGSATVDLNNISLAVRNSEPTIKEFKVTVEDDWGLQNDVLFQVAFQANLAPIGGFSIELVEEIADNEYLLDASASFDADNNLGGFIVEYEYIIDDVVVTIPLNQIYHVFNSGVHTVKLRCRDNDNVWSAQIITTITVP